MQWYRMKKYRSSPSKETFLFSADLYGLEDKTSTMPAYVKLRNGSNCSFDNAESESYWDGTSNDDITDEYDMIWYDMISLIINTEDISTDYITDEFKINLNMR